MRIIRGSVFGAPYVLVFLGSAQAQSVTMGETSVLSAPDSGNGNLLCAQSATLAKTATIQSLSFDVTAASGSLILGIYDATGPNGGPGALKASTKSFTPVIGWNTAKVVTPISLAPGSYWLAYLPSSNSLSFVKTDVSGNCKYYSYNSGSMPNNFSTSPVSCTPTTWSFYATLTVDSSSNSGSSSTVLPPRNNVSANWKNAGMQTVGGIPNRTTVCAMVHPIGGGASDTANIQNAINACPPGEVVQLWSGTFTLGQNTTLKLNKGVTLRGCTASNCGSSQETDDCKASSGTAQNTTVGPGAKLVGSPYCATVINMASGAKVGSDVCSGSGCIVQVGITVGAGGGPGDWPRKTTLTADAAQNATSVRVASTSGFSVGQWVLIDELNAVSYQTDPAAGTKYATGGKVYAASDWASSTGTSAVNGVQSATSRVAWQLHSPRITGDDGTDVFCYFSQCESGVDGRVVAELHKIAAINGNTITFDDPLTIAYQQSGGHNAQLYAPDKTFVQNAGVENLTLQGSTNGGVEFQLCAYCWVKGVEVTNWLGGGIGADYSARIEINKDFVHHAVWPIPGGYEYAIDLREATTEAYIVNTISMLAGKGMTERAAGAGTVVAYNYFDKIMGYPPTWQELGGNGSHTAGSHMTLFEGNWTQNMDNDSTHGTEFYHTFLRNLSTAIRTPFFYYIQGQSNSGQTINDASIHGYGPLRAAGQQEYNYWHAFVGNVLGEASVTTSANGFQLNAAYSNNGANVWPGIWMLGWRDVVPQPVDPNVATRTFRHGNYDYYDNSIQWASGYSESLPNSFYLSSAPSFFSAGASCKYPWPWVTPTSTPQFQSNSCRGSGNPAKARFDAGTPFVQP